MGERGFEFADSGSYLLTLKLDGVGVSRRSPYSTQCGNWSNLPKLKLSAFIGKRYQFIFTVAGSLCSVQKQFNRRRYLSCAMRAWKRAQPLDLTKSVRQNGAYKCSAVSNSGQLCGHSHPLFPITIVKPHFCWKRTFRSIRLHVGRHCTRLRWVAAWMCPLASLQHRGQDCLRHSLLLQLD